MRGRFFKKNKSPFSPVGFVEAKRSLSFFTKVDGRWVNSSLVLGKVDKNIVFHSFYLGKLKRLQIEYQLSKEEAMIFVLDRKEPPKMPKTKRKSIVRKQMDKVAKKTVFWTTFPLNSYRKKPSILWASHLHVNPWLTSTMNKARTKITYPQMIVDFWFSGSITLQLIWVCELIKKNSNAIQ